MIDLLEQDPAAKERIAREELGMANPGEIQFLLPREDGEAAGAESPEEDATPPIVPAN